MMVKPLLEVGVLWLPFDESEEMIDVAVGWHMVNHYLAIWYIFVPQLKFNDWMSQHNGMGH